MKTFSQLLGELGERSRLRMADIKELNEGGFEQEAANILADLIASLS